MRRLIGAGILCAAMLVAACGGATSSNAPGGASGTATPTATAKEGTVSFTLTSDDFNANGPIPARFTCDGQNTSPALTWHDAPANAAAFALIVDDPDAPSGTFTHWVLFNLPAGTSSLPRGVPTTDKLDNGALQGANGAGGTGYTGPCPPSGTHHYHFTLYALDGTLNLGAGAAKQQVLDAMKGHIVAQAEIVGTYRRQ
jgi:Raf kinase inhibitor-like YbhB/YbcL family protein